MSKEAPFTPPGGDNLPQIRVRRATIRALGNVDPTFDHDKFGELLREFQVDEVDSESIIGRVGGVSRSGVRGLQIPFTSLFYINAAKCLSKGGQEALDEEIIRQAYSLAQSMNRRSEIVTNLGFGAIVMSTIGACLLRLEDQVVEKAVESIDLLQPVADKVLPVLSTAGALYLYYKIFGNRRRQSDDFVADPEKREKYKEILVFPGFPAATED